MLGNFLIALLATFHAIDAAILDPNKNDTLITFGSSQSDFDTDCKTQFSGIRIGSRCYFMVRPYRKTGNEWLNGWAACKKFGGQLAQIHTSVEFNRVPAYAQTVLGGTLAGGAVMLGMYDENAIAGRQCVMNTQTTYWYTDQTVPVIMNTLANITWEGRYRSCDDITSQGAPRCFGLWYGAPTPSRVGFGDNSCLQENFWYPMCEFSTKAQSYTRSNLCIMETPVVSIHAASEPECAAACSQEQWCRSFNLLTAENETDPNCQLFTWDINDTNRTSVVCGCNGYSYIV